MSTASIHTERRAGGRVALLTLDNAPVNSLSAAVRQGLHDALTSALADPGVQAIVLTGAGALFCGGAEIREFNTPASVREPTLRDIVRQCEQASKPIVAAMHGTVLGGGLELALGCHYRVAHTDTSLGLPEVKLGILPGGGGTQRLPRAIGVERALSMIVTGDPIGAGTAMQWGLIDAVFDGQLVGQAVAYALEQVGHPLQTRVLGARRAQAPADPAVYARARSEGARLYRGCVAPDACVDCIEQAVSSDIDAGLVYERQRFVELVNGEQSKAQRHLFFAERKAQRPPAQSRANASYQIVGVVGAGTMGGGIAMSLANAGITVILVEREQAALDRGWALIQRNYAATVAKGRLTEQERDARLARIRCSLSLADLAETELVIEAAFEDMAVKLELFRALDQVCKPETVLASNTSRLDINLLAQATGRPGLVLGTHFFSPANVMRLVEVVRGAATTDEVIASVFELARRMKKLPVLVGVCDGFVGNRMVSPYTREAHFLLEEGASPAQVDGALQRFGFAMGPLRMADMAGLDISWAARKRLAPTRPAHQRYSRVADTLCERGRFGQKTGAGFYRYEKDSRSPLPDPEVDLLIEQCAREDGITRRDISDAEIIERTVYALVNEGARILEEGIAARASDIDVIYVHGYGFPIHRGGPMFYADQIGLANVLNTIERFHRQHGELWTPAPLLQRLVREGRSFGDV
ncbi:3-hydroxyacyl-CoA dehydrogenase NAD-binding domain-containing protein [Bordetella genomosp. 4]|uniref:3-hydroxyacyl-CoA dehydrogenase n=1 Tax=Bordetella genomosp. 4 TaxID=463044 RepID=A0A261U8U5_9BORD|nr:3-hydroxyacyl-CoA dehydrogenase NAD-binding domain-containing protein [Bordetella genomosp. 4]OZI51036.1 3-hydroxyacyl-CoA dehydrogenase [Bordetella genomosp. 4]OZI58356.1 3-hydroxyacyl-CoA dehydrogenase [Bordetella genomosp. 4]